MRHDSDIIRESIREGTVFGELFARHARAVGRFAARRVGEDLANDVVSETYLTAFRRRSRFDTSVDSALPWLLGIATNVIHRHRASEARHLRNLAIAAAARESSDPGGTDSVVDRLDADSALQAITPKLATLSKRDRDTLFLYAWGDLGYDGVAQALSVPIGTVKSRLNRVRRILAPSAHQKHTPHSTTYGAEVSRAATTEI